MDVAAAEQDLARRHTDDFATREKRRNPSQRRAIGTRIEQRHDHAAIGNIEVHVAAREALASPARLGAIAGEHAACFARAHAQRAGHRQLAHGEAPALCVTRIVQALPRIARDPVLRIAS